MTKLKDLKNRFMEDAEFREEYARVDEEYALVEALVRARAEAKLEGFTSAAFSCGHGRNPQVKQVYTARIRKLLESHADNLRKLTEDQ